MILLYYGQEVIAILKKEPIDPIDFLAHYLVQLTAQLHDRLDLRPLDLFILQHISREGKVRDGLQTILRSNLTAAITRSFGEHDAWTSVLLNNLEDKGWIVRISLTSSERESLFGEVPGKVRKALSLTHAGEATLDQAKAIASDRSWMDMRGLFLPLQS
jgi:phenylpyruvate tautomerase PptA (4-oxalocrotonate tautomerase family)